MTKRKYSKPKIAINRVYTKKGDSGTTSIIGGHKFKKSSNRIKAFGEVDELNVIVGMCIYDINSVKDDYSNNLISYLNRIQHELFNLGNMIATMPEDFNEKMPSVTQDDIIYMEKIIHYLNASLPSLTSFLLPGGDNLSLNFHLARVICRRCERNVVELSDETEVDSIIISYLNRLSDLFFVLSRWANKQKNVKEFLWNPNFKD